MDEVHLTTQSPTPRSRGSARRRRLSSGVLYTAREGVYRKVVDQGAECLTPCAR